MLVCGLQRLQRVAAQIQRAAHCPAEGCQRTLWNRLDCLVHIRLAYRLHSLRRRHHLRSHLCNAGLRRCGNHPVLGTRRAVTQIIGGGVIQSRGPGAKIWSQIYAHKPIHANGHGGPARCYSLVVRCGKGRPTQLQGSCSRQPVCQVHRALNCCCGDCLRASHPS